MLKIIGTLLAIMVYFAFGSNSYAIKTSESKGACFVMHGTDNKPSGDIYRNFNCMIEKNETPYGVLVSLTFLDPNKQITRAKILEANRECDFNNPKEYNSCGKIDLYNNKKEITSVFSDMTVYANNQGETENSNETFTRNTPNISTCSRYIGMQEAVTVCYKSNAKSHNDVAKGFF